MEKSAVSKLERILKDKNVSKQTKIKIAETLVFPIVTNGSKSWTMRKEDRKNLRVFELWLWWKILRVLWTDMKTNKEILQKVRPNISLEAMTKMLKIRYFGHLSLEKDGKVEINAGARKKGSPVYGGWT